MKEDFETWSHVVRHGVLSDTMHVRNQATVAATGGLKLAAFGGAAYLVLGKPMRTLRIIWKIMDIATRLAMIAGFLAVGYNS